ncbi:flap endonuclease GEN [Temnothorax longispinosus]|uniref:Flap endonuclease GEN n=1 Tax=Temnothorax longispinosus TaxID=300112 RepID=A0A4S2KFI0_9HYME|nr:Flap endonuclease GEN [Temnothorax longispinosus]
MGVKDLWNILSPLCERKPLYELQGKTIAIDLSGWVVGDQTVTDNAAQLRIYLKNLYFRTVFLLMHEIFPIFVLEGKAPIIKHKTIARRNNVRNGNGFQEKTVKKVGRTQFNRVLKECKELLRCMGIACVQSEGEAEAMCAYLNEDGLVDGCISQDSDCFLYGAKVVYRNFNISHGHCDVYSMEKIEKTLNIGRSKMIALALLCGCDYDEGVKGVGKEAALKFFKTVREKDVLQRIQDWRTDRSLGRAESNLLNPNLCTSCGHPGKLQKHTKSGCADCGTIRKCNDDFREKRALILNEVSLRKKALHDENFPNQELIDEFLIRKDSVPTKLDVKWKQPQTKQFIDFMNKYLCWEPQYAFEKIFTLTTRWQLLHLPDLTPDERFSMTDLFIPDNIKKIRNIKSIASYEIIWKKEHTVIEMLNEYKERTRENGDDDAVDDSLLTSIEPQDLVLKCYPELVEVYENTRNAKTKRKPANSRRKKVTIDNNKDTETRDTTKSKQKKVKKKIEKNNRKIDEFISGNHAMSLEESFEKMNITPNITPKRSKRENISSRVNELKISDVPEDAAIMNIKQMKRGPQFKRVLEVEKLNSKQNNTYDKMFNDLSPDDFMSENEDNDIDVTHVIENICGKQTFQFSITNCQSIESTSRSTENVIQGCTKIDEFEPVTYTREDYVHTQDEKRKSRNSDDEFGDINESYIPINQRIQIEQSRRFLSTNNQIKKKVSFDFENIMDQTNNDFESIMDQTENETICLDT